MSDERFVLPAPPKPEPTDSLPHPYRVRLDVIALLIAACALGFSFLQWRSDERQADEARRQADEAQNQTKEAKTARIEAKAASDAQAKDVALARAAAEESRKSAAQLALANEIISETQRRSLALSVQQMSLFQRSVHSAMQPLLYVSRAAMDDYLFAITIANKGRMTADMDKVWCSGSAHIEGSADVSSSFDTAPGIFRWNKIVPDQQEKLELPLIIMPPRGLRRNTPQNRPKQPVSWLVVCNLSYSDELDSGRTKNNIHNLRLCYSVSQSGAQDFYQQEVSMCPIENVEASFKKLGKGGE